jgi:predicted cupin superfamily sugar epimerase
MNSIELIENLQLKPHPEGGFYKETYRCKQKTPTQQGERNVSTAIYYLLENEDKSHFHRIKSDELWFFHQGKPLEIFSIQQNKLIVILLGNNLEKGEVPQAVIPANTWFASHIKNEVGFTLVSCTVAPGFDFSDFEMAKRESLVNQFPHLKDIIEKFTKKNG